MLLSLFRDNKYKCVTMHSVIQFIYINCIAPDFYILYIYK